MPAIRTVEHGQRVAVVMGGGSGIGAGVVPRLAADGYAVAISDWDVESAPKALAATAGSCH